MSKATMPISGEPPEANIPSTPTPATPPATAPAEPPTEGQPPAAEPSAAAPDGGVHDLLLSNILSSLRPDAEAAEPPPITPAPEAVEPPPQVPPAPPVEPAAAPATTPATPEPAAGGRPQGPGGRPPGPKKKTVRSIARGHAVVENNPPPPAPPEPPAPPQPPSAPAAPMVELSEEQVDELAEAAVAERLFGERYKGHTTALKRWYQDFDGRAAALRTQNPNVTEQDDEYQALLASKPAIKPADYRKVAKAMATEAAVQETNQRLAPKLDKIEMDARRAEILPGIQDFSQRVFPQGVRHLIQADTASCLHDPMKLALEKGIEAAVAEYPEEATIMRETMEAQKRRVHEFLLLKNRAANFDAKNSTHQEIASLINEEGQNMLDYGTKNGAQHLVQNGRTFLPRDKFLALLESDRAEAGTLNPAQWTTQKYWTFTDTAIVDIMAIRAKREAENRINFERDRASKLGYVKAPKKSVANPQPASAGATGKPPQALTPPKATPSPTPSPNRPAKPQIVDNSPIPVASVVANLKITK